MVTQEDVASRPTHFTALFSVLVVLTVAISIASVFLLDRSILNQSLFDLVNFTGPTVRSLLHGDGLSFCSNASGFGARSICFHAARMPLASVTVAVGVLIFGDSIVPVSLFKVVLFLVPLEFAIFLVCRALPSSRLRRICCALLLLVPFGMTIFVANVVNLQVEEDYAYSLVASAFAIVLFCPLAPKSASGQVSPGVNSSASSRVFYLILFALTVDALYLSKSSMAPAVVALALAHLFQQRSVALRLVLLALVATAPFGWALYLHHVSGRYSFGTSLDGFNLHKGNDSFFLPHYPPLPLISLDDYDGDLNRGLYFSDEWSFNDYHLHAGLDYIRNHPRETLEAEWRKFHLLYLSLTKYGSSDRHGLRLLIETVGLLLFRLIFWTTVAYSLFALFSPGQHALRPPAAAYLALVVACALPYLIGFGYTRHASILIYPACLMGCRILGAGEPRK